MFRFSFRQKRQLQLTSEGEALKHYAEAMIGIARDIEFNIKTRNTRLRRRLVSGCDG